jgi:hypothetical protein
MSEAIRLVLGWTAEMLVWAFVLWAWVAMGFLTWWLVRPLWPRR